MQNELINNTPNLTIKTCSIEDLILSERGGRLTCNGIITSIGNLIIFYNITRFLTKLRRRATHNKSNNSNIYRNFLEGTNQYWTRLLSGWKNRFILYYRLLTI
jgi:hypothetical protein